MICTIIMRQVLKHVMNDERNLPLCVNVFMELYAYVY